MLSFSTPQTRAEHLNPSIDLFVKARQLTSHSSTLHTVVKALSAELANSCGRGSVSPSWFSALYCLSGCEVRGKKARDGKEEK